MVRSQFFFGDQHSLEALPVVDTTDMALATPMPVPKPMTYPKVGDKVQRTVGEDSFYRIKAVDGSGVFSTDPNSPFEKGWKGRANQFQPHPSYHGYWVPASLGLVASAKKKQVAIAQTKPTKARYAYEVTVPWQDQVYKCGVVARSEKRADVIAAVADCLSRTHLSAYTPWNIRSQLEEQEESKIKIVKL